MGTVGTTPHLGLSLPPSGETGWTNQVNANFTALDTAIYALQSGGATGPAGPPGAPGAVGMIFAGQWSSAPNYVVTDVVIWNGSSYIAIANSRGKQPDTNPNTWSPLALAGAPGPQGLTGPQGPQGASGGGANVSFPVTVPEGGTGGTTPAAALANLGAAANGANSDITSLAGIMLGANVVQVGPTQISMSNGAQSTTISPTSVNTPSASVGALSAAASVAVGSTPSDAQGVVITPSGFTWGVVDALHNGAQIGLNLGGGSGGCLVLSRVGGGTSIDSNGMSTGSITLTTALFMPSGELTVSAITSQSTLVMRPSCPVSALPQVGVAIYADNKASGAFGASIPGKLLLGFEGYPSQAGVGGAGGASAPPATPLCWLPVDVNGTICVIPCYKAS